MNSKISRHQRDSLAQATIEYLVMFTAILVVMILTALSRESTFKTVSMAALNERAMSMEATADRLDGTIQEPSLGNLCGNGVINPPEQCDGVNLNGQSCATMPGFTSGTLSCTAACTFNTSSCVP